MNGADAILKALADNGVDACFANPGTSEMHMVSAFDREPRVRPVLCLFEGVATGAADGFGRMAGRPAATLLHLGPGLSNGSANLHNARRAYSPVVNLIGDHATTHQQYDAPLASDVEALARPQSVWVKSARTADEAPQLAAEAIAASLGPPAGVASLILPADCCWSETKATAPSVMHRPRPRARTAQVEQVAAAVRAASKPVLLLGSGACTDAGLAAAARLHATGKARVIIDTFVSRLPRGAGRFCPDRLPYFGEMALADLAGVDLMVLVSTKPPVAFFAYPAMPSLLVPEGCAVETLAALHEDAAEALAGLADALGAPERGAVQEPVIPSRPSGELNPYLVGDAIARHMPEHAVISDDATTAGLPVFMQTRGARPHDWLMLTGGAIGQGIPAAIGAAIARPDAKVLSLNGDGAAAYTMQGLWTIMREGLNVTTVVFANHAYRILNIELARTGAGNAGPQARRLLDLGDPRIDWTALARGMGMPAVRASDAGEFDRAMGRAMAEPGPRFIEAVMG